MELVQAWRYQEILNSSCRGDDLKVFRFRLQTLLIVMAILGLLFAISFTWLRTEYTIKQIDIRLSEKDGVDLVKSNGNVEFHLAKSQGGATWAEVQIDCFLFDSDGIEVCSYTGVVRVSFVVDDAGRVMALEGDTEKKFDFGKVTDDELLVLVSLLKGNGKEKTTVGIKCTVRNGLKRMNAKNEIFVPVVGAEEIGRSSLIAERIKGGEETADAEKERH